MRVDIKKVRNKQYLQFVDKNGHLYHIGSATDFDSWIISLFLWYQQWEEEANERKNEFFSIMRGKIDSYIKLDNEKTATITALCNQLDTLTQRRHRSELQLPEGDWRFNAALRTRLEPRLREIYYKRRKFRREEGNFKTGKSAEVQKQKEARPEENHEFERFANEILLEFTATQNQSRNVKRSQIATKLAARHETSPALIDHFIERLLRAGEIYEPKEGYLRKT
jgi:hypothetical protein